MGLSIRLGSCSGKESRGPFPRASDPGSSVTDRGRRPASSFESYEPPAAPVSALAMFVKTVLMF